MINRDTTYRTKLTKTLRTRLTKTLGTRLIKTLRTRFTRRQITEPHVLGVKTTPPAAQTIAVKKFLSLYQNFEATLIVIE